jgi:hypothetical protein
LTAARQTWLCTGHVVQEDATSAARAVAWVAWGTAPTPEIAFRTDDNGVFRPALPSGRFRVEARGRDGATGSTELTVEQEALQFEIVLKRPDVKPSEMSGSREDNT